MNLVFSLSNLAVLPFWVLAIFLPRWGWTQRIIASPLIALLPALLYIGLVVPNLGSILPAVANPSATGIAHLLGTEQGVTIAWAHFLAFDLLTARWIFLEGTLRRISPWLISPILALTLLLGPIGFCLYLLVRALPFGQPQAQATQATA